MKGELVAVGSELLVFGRRDSNGDWLASRLAGLGIEVTRRTIVGDGEEEIAGAIGEALRRSGLVVVTGGLGPTADDVTREAVARCLGVPLRTDERVRERIAARLSARGYRADGPAQRQAQVPGGCELIENPVGSAPGLYHAGPGGRIVALPGVPGEMKGMFAQVVELLRGALPTSPAAPARLLVTGMPESEVDQALAGLIGGTAKARVTILAAEGGVELHVLGTSSDGGADGAEVARIVSEIRARLGRAVAAEGEATLADVAGGLLAQRGATLAVAESCTGGLLGATVTSVAGASGWFAGGFIVYSDSLKRELLGVPMALLAEHGAVSEAVARAMAEGARRRTGATHALAITGIAGPSGGTEAKPVGLVHIALAAPSVTSARRFVFGGDRQAIRARSVTFALDLLRRALAGEAA